MKEYSFRVAGFRFGVLLPDDWNIDLLLPSFRPFCCGDRKKEDVLFEVVVSEVSASYKEPDTCLIDDTVNDMGHVRLFTVPSGYRIEVDACSGQTAHVMLVDKEFTRAGISLCKEETYKGTVLCSLLRMMYSQAILRKKAVSVHAAAVYVGGNAYLFMGKSGTGKSTHASLWTSTFEGCRLLNDDNPVIRICEGEARVYGTPWSGKTPCYKNMDFPLAGIVRLKQASENVFFQRKEAEAFITLLPACSVIRKDRQLHDFMCETLIQLTALCTVGILECRPDKEAAVLCASSLGFRLKNLNI